MKVYTHSRYNYVRIAEIQKSELQKITFDLCRQPRETLASYYNRQIDKPDLVINAGFFAMNNGNTCFNYISNGTTVNEVPSYKWGLGVVGDTDVSYGEMHSKNWTGWISGYPNLIDNGVKVNIDFALELNYKARRTMIGYNDTMIYIVCVENPGMNFNQMQDLMLSLGCKYAINLDGGGSTKMLHNGASVTKDVTNRPVDNVIAVYLKEVTQKRTLYKVQVGAFSLRGNAENFLQTVKNLGGDYAKAYITSINGLYKIQVGAFGVKENAEKMMNDLKSKGFSAFIVAV
jgi:hypothetical protein